MKNNLMIFEGNNVEVFEFEGKVLFNPKDVAKCLDISDINSVVRNFNEKQKIKLKNSDMHSTHIRKLNNAGENFLTESGVYKLIFKSRKENAENFQDWVTDEVLPQIRKTGGYVKEEKEEEFIKNYFPSFSEEVKQAMVLDLKHQNEKIQKELEEKNRFLNQISASTNSILVRDVAHLATKENIKIGERRLWTRLREWGLIQKNSTKPMQKALEQGLFEKNEFVIQRSSGPETKFTTRVTGKGQVYIINRLLKEAN